MFIDSYFIIYVVFAKINVACGLPPILGGCRLPCHGYFASVASGEMEHRMCSLTVHTPKPKEGSGPRIASATIQGPGMRVFLRSPCLYEAGVESHKFATCYVITESTVYYFFAALLWKLSGKWLSSKEWVRLGILPGMTGCESE